MDEQAREALADAADALGYAANRLAELIEEEHGAGHATRHQVQDHGKWMRGAKRELAELIREVEGPNPREGGRK